MTSRVAAYAGPDDLPDDARLRLEAEGKVSLFAGLPWWRTFVDAGLPPDAHPAFLVIRDPADRLVAILPCQRFGAAVADRGPGAPAAASLTSFYSCDYRPILADGLPAKEAAYAAGRAARRVFHEAPVLRFDSLDASWPELPAFVAGLGGAGRIVLRYDHFGRWSEDLAGQRFDLYWAARAGALREIVRRKGARLARDGADLVIERDPERAVAAYEAVHARSWKEPEPFPEFQPTLIRNLAAAGTLRLALCRLGDQPIAAQLWALAGGRATVLKLAHDGAFDRLSPGTVLTAFAIRALIEGDGISVLDFGRGDDPYKRNWVAHRSSHVGLLSASLARRPLLIARHMLGAALRRGDRPRDVHPDRPDNPGGG